LIGMKKNASVAKYALTSALTRLTVMTKKKMLSVARTRIASTASVV